MGQSNTHYDNLPTGEHSVLPVDGHSYQPKCLQYCLLINESTADTELIISQRHNLQAIYPLVAKFYNDGYTLNQLKRIPCVKYDNKTLFQVILSRPLGALKPNANEKWQLHVKRSFVTTEHSNSTITTHVTELWRDIQEEACRGARLVSIEPTIPAAHHQVQEVDVFFNMSPRASPSFFIYQAISVPVLWQRDAQQGSEHSLECNWFINFTTFLTEGWKLVEILFDSSVRHRVTVPSRTLTMNSIWVFEKEAAFESISSPRWEGVIVRYMHKSITRFEDFRECQAKTSWDKVIHTMGSRGWELACIVSTPPSIQKGSMATSIHCKVLMFFQRPFTGNKPLHRQTSTGQGVPLSPIRVETFPDWSIIGESHMEGGRPVCLPPYSERGVDIGPLESTPDRPQPAPQLPAEPPPTYAEAVASDVQILFNTAMPGASPPLSPTQMAIPLRIPPNQLPPRRSPVGTIFFDDTANVASTSVGAQLPTSSTSSATSQTRSVKQTRPNQRPKSATRMNQGEPPHRIQSSVSTTTSTDRTVASTSTNGVHRGEQRRAQDSGPMTASKQTTSQKKKVQKGIHILPNEIRQPRGTRDTGSSGNHVGQQQNVSSSNVPRQQVQPTRRGAQNSKHHTKGIPSTSTSEPPPKPPRAHQNVPNDVPSSGPHHAKPTKGGGGEKKGSGRSHQRKPVSQTPGTVESTSRDVSRSDGDSSSGLHHAKPMERSGDEMRGSGRSHQRKPVAQTPRTVESTRRDVSRSDNESSSDLHHAKPTMGNGEDGRGSSKQRKAVEQTPRSAVGAPARPGRSKGQSTSAFTSIQKVQDTNVQPPEPRPRANRTMHLSPEERGSKDRTHHRKPVAQAPRKTSRPTGQSDTNRASQEPQIVQVTQAANFQMPVPLPRNISQEVLPVKHGQNAAQNIDDSTVSSGLGKPTEPAVVQESARFVLPVALPRNITVEEGIDGKNAYESGTPDVPAPGQPLPQARGNKSHADTRGKQVGNATGQESHLSQLKTPIPLPRNSMDESDIRAQAKPADVSQASKTHAVDSASSRLKQAGSTNSRQSLTKVSNSSTHIPVIPPSTILNETATASLRPKSLNLPTSTDMSRRRQGSKEGGDRNNAKGRETEQAAAETEKRREFIGNRDLNTVRIYNRTVSSGEGGSKIVGVQPSAVERLHVSSVNPPDARGHGRSDYRYTERDGTNQRPKDLAKYTGQTRKREMEFNPALIQKRQDRDYERVSGRTEESREPARSKDDLIIHHSRIARDISDKGTVRAKLVEITNTSPRISDTTDDPPAIPPRKKRSSQETLNVRSEQQRTSSADGSKKGSRELSGKALGPMDENNRQTARVVPVKRPLPTYNQALERRTHLRQDESQGPADQPRFQELPDVVRHRDKGDDNFWLIQDVDNDEVFISSQVMPESQAKKRIHSPYERRRTHGNEPKPDDLLKHRSSESFSSPKRPERMQPRNEAQLGMRIELSEADRRSLDSLQSFIVDQKKRPPEYDAVLAKRLVRPKPVKPGKVLAPDLIGYPPKSGPGSQVTGDFHAKPRPQSDWPHGSGDESSGFRPPLPSYNQVVGTRSGAIPKVKVTEQGQVSIEPDTGRIGNQRYPESNRHSSKEQYLGNKQRMTPGPKSDWEERTGEQQPRSLPTHVGHSGHPISEGPSRLSDSPGESIESFDLISQWSQDEVEPPPSRLSKDLYSRRGDAGGTSSGEHSDRESGDYSLANHPDNGRHGTGNYPRPSNLGDRARWKTSSRSPNLSRRRDEGQIGGHNAPRNGSTSYQPSISYNPPNPQRLMQRPLYTSKEIL